MRRSAAAGAAAAVAAAANDDDGNDEGNDKLVPRSRRGSVEAEIAALDGYHDLAGLLTGTCSSGDNLTNKEAR